MNKVGKMKKKIVCIILVAAVAVVAAGLLVPNAVNKITKENVITSSQLEKVINISDLSTA